MTMHSHFSHSLALALPLVAVIAGVVIAGGIGVVVVDPILTADRSDIPLVAAMGEGVDEFRTRAEKVVGPLIPTDFGGWILTVAIFVTIWSVIKVIREMRGPVGGAGDGGALVSHGLHRAYIAIGIRSPGVPWGVVRDAATDHPLPLTRVQLVGTDGAVFDSCVTDHSGRYGFRLSHADAVARGYHTDIQTRKSGYYFRPAARGGVRAHAAGLDIFMDRAGDGEVPVRTVDGRFWKLAGDGAFWVGVLLVPLAFLQSPDLLHGMMFTTFLGAGAVRAVWSKKS